ncbi:hypothetical protein ACL9ST_15970 [Bacillus australimaris]|uniref:hypothetical protein n=1 Tax=Bacillus australimaris TaxID=1326968 RepID=UPI0039B5A6E6
MKVEVGINLFEIGLLILGVSVLFLIKANENENEKERARLLLERRLTEIKRF